MKVDDRVAAGAENQLVVRIELPRYIKRCDRIVVLVVGYELIVLAGRSQTGGLAVLVYRTCEVEVILVGAFG